MARLNQVIAIEKSTKARAMSDLTAVYHNFQKPPLFDGISRTYKPKDEENGDKFPAESKLPQLKVKDTISAASSILSELFDITLTKDTANCSAKSTVEVDGKVLLKDAPVTYLIFLEKQLTDLHTVVKKLPMLDPAERWNKDAATEYHVTDAYESFKTKKVKKNHVKAEATDKHPAQVETYDEDVVVGTWTARKFSGALPAAQVNEMLARIEKLQKAVKFAREEANTMKVEDQKAGRAILDFVFNGK